ncbi:MAG: hypothetical protein HFH68_03585 [Lachnospiraceae bacterium]|nr:hypothetical protein [Lachnospiraceae bacterium]
MEFQSILFADTSIELAKSKPAFFQDLHLDYILNIIKHLTAGDYQTEYYYYTLPDSLPLINYRQDVFKDLMDNRLRQPVYNFCSGMRQSRHSYMLSLECGEPVRAAVYHLEAALSYWEALEMFGGCLENFTPVSNGISLLKDYVLKHIEECRENGFSRAAAGAKEIFSQMRFHMDLNHEGVTINIKEDTDTERDYLAELSVLLQAGSTGTGSKTVLKNIFPNALEPSYLENALVKLLKKSNPGVFKEIQLFYRNYNSFYSEKLLRFEEEVQFYLGFASFKERTEAHGSKMAVPRVTGTGNGGFSGSGIYDIALVWKSAGRDYKVVPNNFCFGSHPSFFVVTGPNQGGKTTFARSAGQAVYFSLMGLPANAASFTMPLFKGISTHFEAEEKIQSNSGKLKEEIDRLVPMMRQDNQYKFVILNELFTTATTNDALIMGKKVMAHFLGMDCYGIYVTHIQELAEETGNITSLVAQVEDNSPDMKRTYRIVHMEAQGHGYTEPLVKKFHLGYEDIIKRLD